MLRAPASLRFPLRVLFRVPMFRVLRRPGSALALRRLVAFVLGVVLAAGCVEPLLADSCDGDAPRSTASAVLPHVDGGAVVGAPVDGVPPDAMAAVDARGGQNGGDRGPQHAVHVCHCTHAHGGALTGRYALHAGPPARPVARGDDAHADRLPPSPALERPLRPPVLPHAA